jgi:hypothetical protein
VKDVVREYAAFFFPLLGQIDNSHPGATTPSQSLNSRHIEDWAPSGVPIGSAAGYVRSLFSSLPHYANVPGRVFDEPSYDVRYYALLLFLLSQPLRYLSALNPSTVLALFREVESLGPALAADLADGTFVRGPAGTERLMRPIAHKLKPAPERAARLRECLANGVFEAKHVWPELEVLTVWKGGSTRHYLDTLRSRLPGVDIRSDVSGSSEASLLTPLGPDTKGGIPALLSTVFEFLPEDCSAEASQIVPISELSRDTPYRLIVSNRRGMYRVLMEDVFFLEGYVGNTPSLYFSHRVGSVSSLTGEKITEGHVIESVREAASEVPLTVGDYQLAPKWGEPPGYVLQVEVDGVLPPTAELTAFLRAFETSLRKQNGEYESKRESGRLAPPMITVFRSGEFQRRLRERLAREGRSDAQSKILKLDRALLPERYAEPAVLNVGLE